MIETEYIQLRRLAMKSKMPGGKFKDRTVENLIESGHEWYLAFIYYRYEHLSFLDEILDRIGITEEHRIQKPGVDLEKLKQLRISQWAERMDGIDEELQNKIRMWRAAHKRKVERVQRARRLERHEQSMERALAKGRLQWKNQGH